jgi:hypothetical protein
LGACLHCNDGLGYGGDVFACYDLCGAPATGLTNKRASECYAPCAANGSARERSRRRLTRSTPSSPAGRRVVALRRQRRGARVPAPKEQGATEGECLSLAAPRARSPHKRISTPSGTPLPAGTTVAAEGQRRASRRRELGGATKCCKGHLSLARLPSPPPANRRRAPTSGWTTAMQA